MRVICAWCQAEGKPAVLHDASPSDEPGESHGICDRHSVALLSTALQFAAPDAPAPDAEDERIARLLESRPHVGLCTSCLAKEVALPATKVARVVARLIRAGACAQDVWWCAGCVKKAVVALGGGQPSAGRILVVEDDPDAVNILTSFFDYRGYRAEVAMHGGDALMLIAQERPDVVLLDMWMPGMDGLEVLRRVRAENPALPVIMVTANDDHAAIQAARRLGAFDYLVKPIDLDVIDERVGTALARARRAHGPGQTTS